MAHGTTEPTQAAPKYYVMLTSGILTAGIFGVGLICLTVYAASPTRPIVTAGLTAICAVATTIGAMNIRDAFMLRKVSKIEQSVDEHGHNVFVDHSALHRDAVKNQEQIGLVFEALGRVLAYEEQRAHLRVEDHHQIGEVRQQLSDVSLDQGGRIERLEEAAKRSEAMLYDIARRLAILAGDNVVDIETLRAAHDLSRHLPKQSD